MQLRMFTHATATAPIALGARADMTLRHPRVMLRRRRHAERCIVVSDGFGSPVPGSEVTCRAYDRNRNDCTAELAHSEQCRWQAHWRRPRQRTRTWLRPFLERLYSVNPEPQIGKVTSQCRRRLRSWQNHRVDDLRLNPAPMAQIDASRRARARLGVPRVWPVSANPHDGGTGLRSVSSGIVGVPLFIKPLSDCN
jgi:hypothetical protein